MSAKSAQAAPKRKASAAKEKKEETKEAERTERAVIARDHLPPLLLVFIVLACSGFMYVLGLRDFIATGRNFFGAVDDAYLVRRYHLLSIAWVDLTEEHCFLLLVIYQVNGLVRGR